MIFQYLVTRSRSLFGFIVGTCSNALRRVFAQVNREILTFRCRRVFSAHSGCLSRGSSGKTNTKVKQMCFRIHLVRFSSAQTEACSCIMKTKRPECLKPAYDNCHNAAQFADCWCFLPGVAVAVWWWCLGTAPFFVSLLNYSFGLFWSASSSVFVLFANLQLWRKVCEI